MLLSESVEVEGGAGSRAGVPHFPLFPFAFLRTAHDSASLGAGFQHSGLGVFRYVVVGSAHARRNRRHDAMRAAQEVMSDRKKKTEQTRSLMKCYKEPCTKIARVGTCSFF